MRQPRPEEFDHYPGMELDPKSEERRAFNNAMYRYWRWKDGLGVEKNLPRERLSDVFDSSLGDDHSIVVQASTRKHVVFYNTIAKIKQKVTEYGGPLGFTTSVLMDNQSGCKTVVFDDAIEPREIKECLRALCPDLAIDDARTRTTSPGQTDTWILIM